MALSGKLGASLTATTNPAPNTLTTVTPYPTPYVDARTVSSTWTTQTATKCKAIFPRGAMSGRGQIVIPIEFFPSTSTATFTVTVWQFSQLTGRWGKFKNNNPVSYTGEQIDYIDNPGTDPLWIQLSAISGGTITIYFDNGLADAK